MRIARFIANVALAILASHAPAQFLGIRVEIFEGSIETDSQSAIVSPQIEEGPGFGLHEYSSAQILSPSFDLFAYAYAMMNGSQSLDIYLGASTSPPGSFAFNAQLSAAITFQPLFDNIPVQILFNNTTAPEPSPVFRSLVLLEDLTASTVLFEHRDHGSGEPVINGGFMDSSHVYRFYLQMEYLGLQFGPDPWIWAPGVGATLNLVPEPSSVLLLGLGLIPVLRKRARR
jgi:hypothetical protein